MSILYKYLLGCIFILSPIFIYADDDDDWLKEELNFESFFDGNRVESLCDADDELIANEPQDSRAPQETKEEAEEVRPPTGNPKKSYNLPTLNELEKSLDDLLKAHESVHVKNPEDLFKNILWTRIDIYEARVANMPPVSETICEQLKMCELTSLILDIQDLTCRHQEHYLIGVKPEQGGPNWEEFFCRIFDLELTQDGSEVEDGKQFFHDSMIRVLKRMKVIDDEMLERLNPFLHKALGAIIDPSLKKNHWELIFELLHARLRSVRDPQHTLNENDIRLCLTSPNYVINAFFALKNKNNWDTISKVCSEYMSFWQKNKCIHTLMIEGPHISFVLLYYFLPEEDFKQLVMIKEGGCNILHFMQEFICDAAALRINYTEVVGPLIAKHFVQLLSDTNDDANNPLHICALRGTTILLEYCLKLVKEGSISKTDLLPVLTARNHEGQTPLEGCGEAPSRTRQLFEQLLLLCGAEEGNKDPEEAISIYSFDDNPPPPPGGNGAESRSIKADWLFQSAFL